MFSIKEEDEHVVQTTTGETQQRHQQATTTSTSHKNNSMAPAKDVRRQNQHKHKHNDAAQQTRDFCNAPYSMERHVRPPSFIATKNLEPKLYREDVQKEYKVLEKITPYASTKRARNAVQSAAFWQQLGPTYETEVEDTPPRVRRYDKPKVLAAITEQDMSASSSSNKQASTTCTSPTTYSSSRTAETSTPASVASQTSVATSDADEYYESPTPRMPDCSAMPGSKDGGGDISPYDRVVDMLSLARLDETFGIGNLCIKMCSDANFLDGDDGYDDDVDGNHLLLEDKRTFEA